MRTRYNFSMAASGILGASGLTLAAVSRHASERLIPLNARSMIETAVNVQMFHAIVILTLGANALPKSERLSGGFFVGVILFCLPIYAEAFGWVQRAWGAPIGGSMLIFCWLAMIHAAFHPIEKP